METENWGSGGARGTEQGLEEAIDAQGRACVGHASARAQIRGIEKKTKKKRQQDCLSTHLAYVFMKSIFIKYDKGL